MEEIKQEYGNNNTSQIVSKYKDQVNDVVNGENIQLAKELMDQIRSLNFSLVDQGAGVALDIAMIKGFDDEFNTHDWSNINQARALLNQAKQIISTNPTKASLRPIVVGLYDLLPNLDRPITEDDDETVLTN